MSDSERRLAEKTISCRVTLREHTEIMTKAAGHGFSAGQYMKLLALRDSGKTLPVLRKRPPDNADLLRELIAGIGRVGGLLNQIAKIANATGFVRAEVAKATQELADIRALLADALRVRDP
jgi:hypothetical protein